MNNIVAVADGIAQERLTRRVDFQKAYRDGRRWNGRWVNLFDIRVEEG